MEELLCMVGLFITGKPKEAALSVRRSCYRKHLLGTWGQYLMVGDMHGVFNVDVYIPVFISDRRGWGCISRQ